MPQRPRPLALVSLLTVLAVVAAGCGDDDEPVITAPDGAAGTLGDGPAGLSVVIDHEGGFTTPDRAFAQLPLVVVYDDGTTVTQGAMIMIYPGPAVPPLVTGQLDADQMAELETSAREAGLFEARGPDDFGMPNVADAPDTRITVVVDGEEVVTRVGALGFGEPGEGGPEDGVSAEQAERRAAVEEFVSFATGIGMASETGEVFEVDRYRVVAAPYEERAGDEEIEPNELDWPAEVGLDAGDCIPVTGADADALADALDEATEITRWVDADGAAWHLAIRPVLPHEPDC